MTLTARQPRIRTNLPGENAKLAMMRDKAVMSPSYPRPYPLVPSHGNGVWLTDIDGNEFLDFMAGIAVSTTGYNHPHVTKAVQDQTARYMHICLADFPQLETTRLAERLSALAGGGYRAFFGNSGAEAVEAAVKLARYHTGRSHVISTTGSFHGRTTGALALTASKAVYRRGFGGLPNVTHIPYPNPFRPPFGSSAETCGKAVLDYLEQTVLHHIISPDEVAAIILEPMQGEGGYIVPPPDFLPAVRELCDRHGILLILDEVQTGMGRTGKFFGYQHVGIRPDIIAIAKGLASGLPLGAMLAKSEIMQWPVGAHGSTFGGNPVATAAANATIDLLIGTEADTCPNCTCGPDHACGHGLIANAERVGQVLMDGLRALQLEYPQLVDVRGKGLFIGLEFADPVTLEPKAHYRDALAYTAFEMGLLTLPCGASTLRFAPPLILTEEEAKVGLDVFRKALEVTPFA
jgi:4-aminobutyrate aminotransferase